MLNFENPRVYIRSKIDALLGVLIPKIKVTVTKQGKENTPMKYRPKHRKQPWWHRLIFGRRVNPYEFLTEMTAK
ncbi:hypothetical protein CIP107580_01824 [Corynebacterium diphtheriae]|nr:hypothetical protein CIP107533_01846 [Corynebacterium diphtheriae]CAB0661467.1 hypothetical protein CIP107580_01824 [Corynebacterium diphtheriae]